MHLLLIYDKIIFIYIVTIIETCYDNNNNNNNNNNSYGVDIFDIDIPTEVLMVIFAANIPTKVL